MLHYTDLTSSWNMFSGVPTLNNVTRKLRKVNELLLWALYHFYFMYIERTSSIEELLSIREKQVVSQIVFRFISNPMNCSNFFCFLKTIFNLDFLSKSYQRALLSPR